MRGRSLTDPILVERVTGRPVVLPVAAPATIREVVMPEETYTPEHDVTKELPDGRTIQVAAKGVPVSMARARELGLVKDAQQAGPSETKADAETERVNAQAAAAEQENTGNPDADAPSVERAEAGVDDGSTPPPTEPKRKGK